jgi:hypothetical protein
MAPHDASPDSSSNPYALNFVLPLGFRFDGKLGMDFLVEF